MTKKEAVELLKLEEKGAVDYALPQQFADNFKEFTGVYPINCFVWFYPNEGPHYIFGIPYPLTVEAKELLVRYNRLARTSYPIPKYPKALNLKVELYG